MSKSSKAGDHRRFQRIPAETEITIWRADGSELAARLRDLSGNGLSFTVPTPLDDGERIHVIIAGGLATLEPAEIDAAVVRVEAQDSHWLVAAQVVADSE